MRQQFSIQAVLVALVLCTSAGFIPPAICANDSANADLSEKDERMGPYLADLKRRVKRAWFPPKGKETQKVTVKFKVLKDGRMEDARVSTSSEVAVADQAALKAVENAAPFRPLPAVIPDNYEIELTFDYNLFSGGGGGSFSGMSSACKGHPVK